MKFTISVATIALGAIALSSSLGADAALSAGCSTYLSSLEAPTNPLANCRVYTALGFPALTFAKDHDTPKLQKALTSYCATPACTTEQYAGVYKALQTNCAADMVTDNQATLGTVMYMWYMSPAQREAVCFQDASKNSSCVVDSINEMIARGQLPDANPNEDDLYGYIQYVTPMMSPTGTNTTAFCTSCNQQIANIFSNYYTKTPAPYTLNFAQNLTSLTLNTNLMDQYKRNCGATLGLPSVGGNGAGNGTAPSGTFQPTNLTQSGGKTASNAASGVSYSMGGIVAALATVVSALVMV
ncbi:hypothetical protein BC939DRAFT_462857 [Gamsiella multidivaricata]|uniref:uncharacterized protein n=1 Tax=Gamsiella multidivaricata TaxID=101098 RepID=UPI00221E824C|nr:uncharacterized protein BC939DRAFT_462857 [Gamsiella multidivaricata]KAG0353880.1 hypothetical protein BGZ54_001994 [Gamsiella multidivaricata]KAI7818448.1 hypothetical protein BC939DRAFT_462857 [Gamsiella multidivaricata]